jgi:hypothetical protein
MLAKGWWSSSRSAAEARHNGSGWQTLSFDFNALKIIQLLRIDRIQFSFLYGSLVVVLNPQQ